jgi:hypothetical protein
MNDHLHPLFRDIMNAAARIAQPPKTPRVVIATEVQPSNEPGAWTCKACGFRGFWRGGPHCAEQTPSGVKTVDGGQK